MCGAGDPKYASGSTPEQLRDNVIARISARNGNVSRLDAITACRHDEE
jgi:hypothetical protein